MKSKLKRPSKRRIYWACQNHMESGYSVLLLTKRERPYVVRVKIQVLRAKRSAAK